jgi:hypothetical protein
MTDFGTDLSCVKDISADCREVSDRRVVAEAIARRFLTPRAGLLDDPNYGDDLTIYLNDDITRASIAQLESQAIAECQKDERVLSATAVAVQTDQDTLEVTITLDVGDGPFDLVLSVSSVSSDILRVT